MPLFVGQLLEIPIVKQESDLINRSAVIEIAFLAHLLENVGGGCFKKAFVFLVIRRQTETLRLLYKFEIGGIRHPVWLPSDAACLHGRLVGLVPYAADGEFSLGSRVRKPLNVSTINDEPRCCRLIGRYAGLVEHRLRGKQTADDVIGLGSLDVNRDGHFVCLHRLFGSRRAVFLSLRSPSSFRSPIDSLSG